MLRLWGKGLGTLFMFRLVGSAFRVQAQLGLVALLHALGKLFPPNNLKFKLLPNPASPRQYFGEESWPC